MIAELSANHNGTLERALESIEVAKQCGADAVKIQSYSPDTMTIDSKAPDFQIRGGLWDGYTLYELYQQAQTPFHWHQALFDHARQCGITLFSTPFDESAVDLLEGLETPAYKIASFELTDLPLIRYVAATGKPMILSTGMASENEIEEAVSAARESGCRELVLLHCISSYPTPIDQAHLRQIPALRDRFGVATGLSDHTQGTTAAIAAVALGASVIEKHFTLSRSDGSPDSPFSLEPDELSHLCREVKNAWLALGGDGFSRSEAEQSSQQFRRSVYFVTDLPAGTTVKPHHIRRIRPGHGLPPKHFDQIVGQRLNQPVTAGTPTDWKLFEG